MKKLLIAMAATATLSAAAGNPLSEPKWNTPHQTPPFGKIKNEHFVPAIKAQIADAKQGINAIVRQRSVPTFENTIEALERNDQMLSRTLGVLFNLNSANTTPELQAVVVEVTPLLTEYNADVSLNEALFNRIRQVWDLREKMELTTEQARLLEEAYKSFSRNGANLSGEEKEQYRKITSELADLSVKFDQNELAATNAFSMQVTDKAQLSGLPDAVLEAAEAEAQSRGKDGYVFTLHYPSYVPFVKYADNRDLREQMWRARGSLCATGDSLDNQATIKRIAELRLDLAKLLGYPTFADYALKERMAGSSAKVQSFLNELLEKTIAYAKKDAATIEIFARNNGFKGAKFMPWDFNYWNEKYVTKTFSVNDEMTRPYFQLEDAEKALFLLANKLYGINFVPNKKLPIYHPDVVAYDVMDKDGKFLAVLYCDYFPRASKNSGAWMNTFREGSINANGEEVRPIVVLVNNFTKPTATKPSLLSFDEFTTMLHEFGHGMHGMFAKGNYASLTGTNVYRDFVELPSQIMENWACEKEYLDLFAKHYQTGEKMPAELINKLIAAKNHLAAYNNVNQVRYALNDMAWHSITEPIKVSVQEFERAATEATQIMPTVDGMMMSPAFGHIFAGGYAAGYYSYKWAEVLEADAFSKFKEAGVLNSDIAGKFRSCILEAGGTEHPMTIFVRFAGAEPTIAPLIEKMGLK